MNVTEHAAQVLDALATEQPATQADLRAQIDDDDRYYIVADGIGYCNEHDLVTEGTSGWMLTEAGADIVEERLGITVAASVQGPELATDGGHHRGYDPRAYDDTGVPSGHVCSHCGAEFDGADALQAHLSDEHTVTENDDAPTQTQSPEPAAGGRTCPLCGEPCSELPAHLRGDCRQSEHDSDEEPVTDGGTTTDDQNRTPEQPDPVHVNGHLVALDTLTCHHCGVYKETLGRFASHSCSGGDVSHGPAERCLASIHRWLGGIDGTELSGAAHDHLTWARAASSQLAAGPVRPSDADALAVHFSIIKPELSGEEAEIVRHCQQLLEGIRQFARGGRQ